MTDVKTISAWMPVTNEALEDAPVLLEAIAIGLSKTPPNTRYHRVWNAGYHQALEDIRSGALELRDGHFHAGPNWMRRFQSEWFTDDERATMAKAGKR